MKYIDRVPYFTHNLKPILVIRMQLWTLLISPTTSFPHFNISPILMYTVLAKTSSQTKIKNKKVLNFIKQVFFLLLTEGSLGDIRAYLALHLGGTPSQETGISPPSCLLLENRLYIWRLKLYFDFRYLPCTCACQAMRDIMSRGWSVEGRFSVQLGLLSSSAWIAIFLLLSIIMIKIQQKIS